MFVSGTRDGFASIQEMSEVLKLIPARTELLAVQGSGHELMTKRNRDEVQAQIAQAFQSFRENSAP